MSAVDRKNGCWSTLLRYFERASSATAPAALQAAGVCQQQRWKATTAPSPTFVYQELFEMAKANVPWRKLTSDHVAPLDVAGKRVLQVRSPYLTRKCSPSCRGCACELGRLCTGCAAPQVAPEALTLLADSAMRDVAHLLRPGHLQQLSNILKDPEVSGGCRRRARQLVPDRGPTSHGTCSRAPRRPPTTASWRWSC